MQTIRLSDYGIYPDSDITLSLYELFQRYPNDTEFIFEEGDYYFSPKKEMLFDYRLSNMDQTDMNNELRSSAENAVEDLTEIWDIIEDLNDANISDIEYKNLIDEISDLIEEISY